MVTWHMLATLSFSFSKESEVVFCADVLKAKFYEVLNFFRGLSDVACELVIFLAKEFCMRDLFASSK
jgi:hypothetical protein